MKNLKQSFVYKRVRKTYRKARKTVLDKGKTIENNLIGYLESEVAPSISVAKFSSTDVEYQYYAKIASLKNIYAMLVELQKNNPFLSEKEVSHKLIAISKVVTKEYSNKELRFLLALLAFDIHRDSLTFSSLFWSCIHTMRYQEAAKTLNHYKLNQPANLKQIESFKYALSIRLPERNVDEYLEENNVYKKGKCIKDNFLQKQALDIENKNLELIKQKDFKTLADIIFTRFKGSKNIDEILDYINLEFRASLQLSAKTIQLILINTGKEFGEHGEREVQVKLLEEAIDIEKNPLSVRAIFWAYNRKGDIKGAKESLDWLEEYGIKEKDSKQIEFARMKRNSYLFINQDYIKDLVKYNHKILDTSYNPIPDSIAYVLHNTLPYASGGYATRAHGLAEAIKQKKYNITMVGRPGFPLDIRKELISSEVNTTQFIDDIKYVFNLHPRRDQTSVKEFIELAADELVRSFLEIRPAIVVAASNHLTGIPALIAARRLGVPFIYEVRGFWEITRVSREPEFENTELYRKICELEAIAASNADHVFTLTTPMKEELVSRGIDDNNITILPNSCNPERFEPKDRDESLASKLLIPGSVPVIGYIGTFVQYEGLEHLAEACGLLKEKGIEFRLLIVGNENTAGENKGPISEAIESIAHKYQFEDWLIMPGRVPHEEVEAYYSLIDIAPFPRKPQPVTEMVSPMKPLEAAAMKKAIVVSSVRALTDMITDGVNGLVFEKGDISDLSKQLEILIVEENLKEELGENARKWVEKERTWDITAETMSNVLNKIRVNKDTVCSGIMK